MEFESPHPVLTNLFTGPAETHWDKGERAGTALEDRSCWGGPVRLRYHLPPHELRN